ncbi:exodeoxyribonuclease V subunit gamma [Shewanella maritima]|uniref:RecBCD enzyme subunit RecC n=1 Tax=Shewanella maritima TaxID=2520507 RepID=A0A411PE09_9GAMM|nr:exodeoxyribonuclease V subunit gamma [Shewanella maritima]QBF81630.1 exodeoxyribonuclease V subunit gamma [Shewanella maritima]
MLKLIQSNQMEVLSAQLSLCLATPAEGAPLLADESILVQSPGMSTWLRLEVAKYNQIAAGLTFPLPSSFTWQLCHSLLPNVPKDNAFTKAAMTWKLIDLLPTLLSDSDFSPLTQYLSLTSPIDDEQLAQIDGVKLYQLCGRIADIFDQYLVYRPQWILAWEQQLPLTEIHPKLKLDENQLWQAKLWRALISYNRDTLAQSEYHRANLHADLLSALENPNTDISELPNRLFVFGISSMPPQTLEVLYKLATRIDVTIFSLSPCQHYWGDIVDPKVRARMALQYAGKKQLDANWENTLEVGNPLLANNGKMGRELLDLMLSLPEAHTDFGDDCYIEIEPDNLLHGVQYDILQMETLGRALGPQADIYQDINGRRTLSKVDDSITLRSCHSPLREVETLHDHILNLLSDNPELAPKDIVIMLPDVAAYAPYIDAVFGTANSQHFEDLANYWHDENSAHKANRYLPYAIADRGAAQESPLINSFLTLLNINQSRFSLSEIISILEVPAILRRFGLDDDDLNLIRRWLDDANVRWGRDEQSRAELGLPEFDQNSWAFGIKRLILGYAMHDEADIYQHTLPVAGVEGQSAQALGKLLNFIETIDYFSEQFKADINSHDKLALLGQLLDDCYDAIDDEQQQLLAVREALAALDTELANAGHKGKLEIEILRQWFTQRLTESRVGQRYLAGSINFCTLMPMRSIPFKVVCLLGMNDGVYPRVQHPVGFDLMAHFGAEKGDRSRRLDDRYLFLEALLSARQQLYISYIGHSERDNTERLPSMLVSELIEFIQMSYLPEAAASDNPAQLEQTMLDKAVIEQLIIEQPLQPFDKQHYQANELKPSLHSFNQQWCPPAQSEHQAPTVFIGNKPIINIEAPTSSHELDENLLPFDTTQDIELSALMRFYRNPAQYFFNRTLQLDLSLNIDADDNDEPFAQDNLARYNTQSMLISNALGRTLGDEGSETDTQLIDTLKAAGGLPLAPFNDLILERYQQDIAPLVSRIRYLYQDDNVDDLSAISIDLECNVDLGKTTSHLTTLQLTGRIDNLCTKGLVGYRPSQAHGRDIIQLYLRHLCLNAMGETKHSYLIDIKNFHSFAPLSAEQATAQLSRFMRYFVAGQSTPLCLPPRTSFVYASTEGEHQEKLNAAEGQWHSSQSSFLEGNEAHNKRLFSFPDNFDTPAFTQNVDYLFAPMVSLYHSDALDELETFVTGAAIEQHAQVVNQAAGAKELS